MPGCRLNERLLIIQAGADSGLRHLSEWRDADAMSRQDAGQRINQHAFNPEQIRHRTRMLTTCATETAQRKVGGCLALSRCDVADGIGHVLCGYPQKPLRCFFRSVAGVAGFVDVLSEFVEGSVHGRQIGRLIPCGPEYFRQRCCLQPARHHVGIGNGQRAFVSVGLRSRISTC